MIKEQNNKNNEIGLQLCLFITLWIIYYFYNLGAQGLSDNLRRCLVVIEMVPLLVLLFRLVYWQP